MLTVASCRAADVLGNSIVLFQSEFTQDGMFSSFCIALSELTVIKSIYSSTLYVITTLAGPSRSFSRSLACWKRQQKECTQYQYSRNSNFQGSCGPKTYLLRDQGRRLNGFPPRACHRTNLKAGILPSAYFVFLQFLVNAHYLIRLVLRWVDGGDGVLFSQAL